MENNLEERAQTLTSNWKYVARYYRKLAQNRWLNGAMLVLLFGSGMVAYAALEPFLDYYNIDPKLQAAHDRVRQIGSPLGPSSASVVYEESHEHALIIWVQAIGKHFVLFPDSKVLRQNDLHWQSADWMDDATTQKRLNLPASCAPPRGGAAIDWSNDPEKWRVMGCRQWYCGSASIVQQFGKGYLIGPIGYGESETEPDVIGSRIIVVFDDDKWEQEPAVTPASKCPPSS